MHNPLWKWFSGFLGNLCGFLCFAASLLIDSPMTSGQMTYHPGTHPTYPGPSSLALVLPFCLPLGAKEEDYGKGACNLGAETCTQRERPGHL